MKGASLLLVLAALLTAGCAMERKVYLNNGGVAHVIDCSSPNLNFGHCIEEAGQTCRSRGYTVIDSIGGQVPDTPNTMPTGGLLGRPSLKLKERKLLIKCN